MLYTVLGSKNPDSSQVCPCLGSPGSLTSAVIFSHPSKYFPYGGSGPTSGLQLDFWGHKTDKLITNKENEPYGKQSGATLCVWLHILHS